MSSLVALFAIAFGVSALFQLFSRAALSNQVFRFGTVREGDTIQHTFLVRNRSLQTVHVDSMSSSCGCTVPKLDWDTIGPFEKRSVSATIDLTGRNGPVESEILLRLSKTETVTLGFEGYVIDDSPDQIDLGEFKRGEQVSREFLLRPLTPDQLVVESVKVDDKKLQVTYKPDEKSLGVMVTIRPADGLPFGHFGSPIVFHTNDRKVPVKTVSVMGSVQSRLVVSKKFVSLGKLGPGNDARTRVDLNAPYGDKIRIQSISSSMPEFVTGTVVEPPDPSAASIEIAAHGLPDRSGIVRTDLAIEVWVGDELERTSVEVYCSVPDGSEQSPPRAALTQSR